MTLAELKSSLAGNEEKTLRFVLPTGGRIPPHTHVTEVALIDKKFVDCGGTFRTESICRLQTWHHDDTDHRLTAGKLLGILGKAGSFIRDDGMEVEVEHEAPFISQFPIADIAIEGSSLLLHLGIKHTDCLAKELCLPPKSAGVAGFKTIPTLQKSGCCGSNS